MNSRPLRLSTQLRLAGFGFKACSRRATNGRHGLRALSYLAMRVHSLVLVVDKTSMELAISIVIGKWISPYVVGRVVGVLLDHYVPKDPILPPAEVFAYPGMNDFKIERVLLA